MSQLQFSKTQYVNTFTDNEIRSGSFKTNEDLELTNIIPMVFFGNLVPTTQQIRCNIYADSTYTNLLYQSSWYIFNYLGNLGPYGRWYIPIEFNKENISNLITYYVAFELGNYVHSSTSYLALEYDNVDSIYTNETVVVNSPHRYLVFGNVKPV
jgi:hypothetical protein